MEQWLKMLAFGRRIAEEIAEGRVEASAIKDMTDEQLSEFDAEVFQGLQDALAENKRLASEPPIE